MGKALRAVVAVIIAAVVAGLPWPAARAIRGGRGRHWCRRWAAVAGGREEG